MAHVLGRTTRGTGVVWRLATTLALLGTLLGAVVASPGGVAAATCNVTSTADSGAGSLRAAIGNTDGYSNCDLITFGLPNPSTITLTSDDLRIERNLTIQGPAANQLTVARSSAEKTPEFSIFVVTRDVTAAISGLTISGGIATYSDGGGIFNVGNLTLTGVAVRDNYADDDGGGIYSEGTLAIANSTISGNEAGYGGGISSEGTLTITNSTIAGNSAPNHGGGLDNFYGGTMIVSDSTIAGNDSSEGANIMTHDDDATTTLYRTIVADGVSGTNCATDDDATIVNGGYNLDSDASCGFGTTNSSISGVAAGLNPAGLTNNGGPTETIALLSNSPAINRVPASGADCPATDQRGVARPQGGACDSGAVEQRPAPTILSQVGGSASYGGPVTLTARLTQPGIALAVVGQPITFTLGGTPVGAATTNAQGVATLTGVAFPAGLNAGSYANRVCASFAGDTEYAAAGPTCGPLVVQRRILWLKPTDRTVGLRQPNPPTTPPAGCVQQQTPTSACWLDLANGSTFAPGENWANLSLSALRFQYNRNPPATNASEYVNKTYKITAFGAASMNYDIRYQQGTLTVK